MALLQRLDDLRTTGQTEEAVRRQVICPVLIGRSGPAAALRRALDAALAGEGGTVLLAGEAGIGKSRLVAEMTAYATAQGAQVLEGACFPQDRTCPYAPLLDLLRTHFRRCSGETIAAALGPLRRDARRAPTGSPSNS